MSGKTRVFCAVLSSCMVLAESAIAADKPATAPSVNSMTPQYPIPYGVPSVESITKALQAIRGTLETRLALRYTDPQSQKVMVDPATAPEKPAPGEPVFGPMDYPAGVAYSGLLEAGQVTGDQKFIDDVNQRFNFIAAALPKFPLEQFPKTKNPFRHLLAPESLDDCGAITSAIVRAKRMGLKNDDLQPVIDRAAKHVMTGQLRLADGTLARPFPFKNSVWADDMYMSVSLLAQLGAATGDKQYFADAAKQILGISHHLYIPSANLLTHAIDEQIGNDQPHYFWGRANGWCMVAMADLLEVIPADDPARADVLEQFQLLAKGVASTQSGTGLWHQMLDRPDSFLETSCSAMFTCAIARGVNNGWLDFGAYGPVAVAGWDGVSSKIDSQGHLSDVCIGTGYAADYVYYYHRPAIDDVHGYGPVLMAGAEMIKLLNNPKLEIKGSNPVMVKMKK